MAERSVCRHFTLFWKSALSPLPLYSILKKCPSKRNFVGWWFFLVDIVRVVEGWSVGKTLGWHIGRFWCVWVGTSLPSPTQCFVWWACFSDVMVGYFSVRSSFRNQIRMLLGCIGKAENIGLSTYLVGTHIREITGPWRMDDPHY